MSQGFDEQVERLLGAALFAVARGMVDVGVTPSAALRLVGLVVIEGSMGPDAIKALGMPTSTANRWRAELREALSEAELPPEPPVAIINELLPYLGVKGLEVRAREEAGK